MLIFGATGNCIPWVIVPEILPLHARAKGTAIGISANWLWNFVVVMITPSATTNLKWKAYLIFMCLNLAFIPMVYCFFPETSGLTLEEIDFLFTRSDVNKASTQKKWFRTEDVMRSLNRESLHNARTYHRGSLAAANKSESNQTAFIDGEKNEKHVD